MNLFEEVGLLPDLFDAQHYESLSHQESTLRALLPRLRATTLVRAVEETKWNAQITDRCRRSLPAQKVLETLMKDRRIIYETTTLGEEILDWPSRFAESHRIRPLRVLVSDDLFGSDPNFKPTITNISKLITEDWWSDLTLNTDVDGTNESFVAAIRLPLTRAARIEIVDPWLLPTKDRSVGLLEQIVKEVARNPRVSAFRIHSSFRALESDSDRSEESVWRLHFERLGQLLADSHMSARVFVWRIRDIPDKFHDRYLLTELGSCQIGRGFEVQKGFINTFYRLDRKKSQDLETVFRADINSTPKPVLSFRIGTARTR
jgi:hypothetical protein